MGEGTKATGGGEGKPHEGGPRPVPSPGRGGQGSFRCFGKTEDRRKETPDLRDYRSPRSAGGGGVTISGGGDPEKQHPRTAAENPRHPRKRAALLDRGQTALPGQIVSSGSSSCGGNRNTSRKGGGRRGSLGYLPSPLPIDDASTAEVVGREGHLHFVPGNNSDVVLSHLAG